MGELVHKFNDKSLFDLVEADAELTAKISELVQADDVNITVKGNSLSVEWGEQPMVWENGPSQRNSLDDKNSYFQHKVEMKLTDEGHLTTKEQHFRPDIKRNISLMGANVDLSQTNFSDAVAGIVEVTHQASKGVGNQSMGGRFLNWKPA